MCARYTLTKKDKEIAKRYRVKNIDGFLPNYNIAPTQQSLVLTADEPNRLQAFHFGLVPHWAKDKKIGYSLLNARSETALEKPSFKPLIIKNKRCLVIADGFYEWKTEGKEKLPFRFVLPGEELFSFAGLWSQWIDPVSKAFYHSFAIMTTSPNQTVAELHDRMPVILSEAEEKLWLDGQISPNEIMKLCDSFPDQNLRKYAVSKDVNKVSNNHDQLILPLNSK